MFLPHKQLSFSGKQGADPSENVGPEQDGQPIQSTIHPEKFAQRPARLARYYSTYALPYLRTIGPSISLSRVLTAPKVVSNQGIPSCQIHKPGFLDEGSPDESRCRYWKTRLLQRPPTWAMATSRWEMQVSVRQLVPEKKIIGDTRSYSKESMLLAKVSDFLRTHRG